MYKDVLGIDIEIDSKKYKLIYWVKTKTASVWHGTHCILCGYDKYHSDMAIKTMKERIKKVFDNADEETKQITKELNQKFDDIAKDYVYILKKEGIYN